MCGRIAFFDEPQAVASQLGYPLARAAFPPASYNIAPGGPIVAIAATDSEPKVTSLQWTFKPRWAPEDAPRTHVARAERLASSRFWKGAFARHRCLIPVNGWYEWRHDGDAKLPYYFHGATQRLLLLAGVFTTLADGQLGCAVVTQPAQGRAKDIHSRMPVVVGAGAEDWLSTEIHDRETLKQRLRRVPIASLAIQPVSQAVNSTAADSADLILPISPPEG